MIKRFSLLLILSLCLLSCSKEPIEKQLEEATRKAEAEDPLYSTKDFIWKGLNQYYLWQEEINDLSDTRFEKSLGYTNATSKRYVSYLKNFSTPKVLFKYLLSPEDRFSFIVKDIDQLEDSFQGISLSTGMDYALAQIETGEIVGYVRYVFPNSDAEKKGVKRGDFFLSVDGQRLTTTNYQQLLFNQKNSLTFGFFKVVNKQIVPTESKTLSQLPLQEDPILLHKTLSRSGKKIGYLVYNSFVSKYDKQLNEVFGKFKSDGISDLVLDLRYNSGGSVQTAIYLASMIKGTDTNKVFVKQTSNTKMINYWKRDHTFENNISGTPIHTLNLPKIYILTSKHTASASELIINGLKPYLTVVQIGETTLGKNLASITLKDKTKGSKWAMQPIVLRSENAAGFGHYETGLVPNFEIKEDVRNLGTLGDENEPLLAKALELITGMPQQSASLRQQGLRRVANRLSLEEFDHCRSRSLTNNRMYIDNPTE
nr:S41 family peptidase [uncultured Capnocytophaga sp.]